MKYEVLYRSRHKKRVTTACYGSDAQDARETFERHNPDVKVLSIHRWPESRAYMDVFVNGRPGRVWFRDTE